MCEFVDGDVGDEVLEGDVTVGQFQRDGVAKQPDDVGAVGHILGGFFGERDAVIEAGYFVALALRVVAGVEEVVGNPVFDLNHHIAGKVGEGSGQVGRGMCGDAFDVGKGWGGITHVADMDIFAAL